MFNLSTLPSVNLKDSTFNSASIKSTGFRVDLIVNDELIDGLNCFTNSSVKQQYSAYDLAKGSVLLNRLGLGYMALWIASKESVSKVTVLEKNKDVIDIFLSNNTLPSNVVIINENAKDFKSDECFDFAYLDHDGYKLNPQYIHKDYINSFINTFNLYVPNCKEVWFCGIEQMQAQSVVPSFDHLEAAGTIFKRPHEGISEDDCCCWEVAIAANIGQYGIDFHSNWDMFFKYNMPTLKIPSLSKEKVNEYVYSYYQKIGYGSDSWIR
jgi:hypothetical protein